MAVKCCVADDDVIVQYEVEKDLKSNKFNMRLKKDLKKKKKKKSVVSQDSKDVGFKKNKTIPSHMISCKQQNSRRGKTPETS